MLKVNNLVGFWGRQFPFFGETDFSGAMVKLNNDLTTNFSNIAVTWEAEVYDHGGWWSAGNPTRFTVPSGVSYVRLIAQTQWTGMASTINRLQWFHINGTVTNNLILTIEAGSVPSLQRTTSPVLESAPGDIWELICGCTDTSTTLDADGTFFAIEKVA